MSAAAVARLLIAAVQQVRHYGADHPAARQAMAEFYHALAPFLTQGTLRIGIGQRTITVQGISLPPEDQFGTQLHPYLGARQVEAITVASGVTETAVAGFIRLLAREPEELIVEGGLEDALRANGIDGISVQTPSSAVTAALPVTQNVYTAAMRTMEQAAAEAGQRGSVDIPRVLQTVEGLVAVLNTQRLQLWRNIAARGHDELDPPHAVNTCLLAIFVGEALNLPKPTLVHVGLAALCHDIGLLALPADQRLQERIVAGVRAEWRHPAEGAYLLRHLGGRESLPMIVAAEHHLSSLSETPVLPHTQLVALADYLDATTCGRMPSLRQASVGTVATQLLQGLGPRFDPVHVRVLVGLLHRQQAAGVEFASV